MTTTDIATVLLGAGCFCLSLDLIRLKRRITRIEHRTHCIHCLRRRRQP